MILSGTYYNSHGHDSLYFQAFDNPSTNNGIAQECRPRPRRPAFRQSLVG